MTLRSLSLASVLLLVISAAAQAQGVVWSLPKDDNVVIRYTGEYTHKGPPDTTGTQKLTKWTRHLAVKVFKNDPKTKMPAQAFIDGKEVACRWIELVVRTGEFDANRPQPIDAGPAGQRMYRVLVPESAIVGKTKDDNSIFVSMLPIAKDKAGKVMGIRKIGEGKAEWMKAPVLQVYPIVSMLHHYRDLKPKAGGDQAVTIETRTAPQTVYTKKPIAADKCKASSVSRIIEGRQRRLSNTGTIILCDEIPTGLLGWDVKVVNEKIRVEDEVVNGQKTGRKVRKFELVSEVTCKMNVRQVSIGDARSQLPDPAN